MSGVLKIEIVESEAGLRKLLTTQKSTKMQERVQVRALAQNKPSKECRTSSSNV